jgi:hypothetical protein
MGSTEKYCESHTLKTVKLRSWKWLWRARYKIWCPVCKRQVFDPVWFEPGMILVAVLVAMFSAMVTIFVLVMTGVIA